MTEKPGARVPAAAVSSLAVLMMARYSSSDENAESLTATAAMAHATVS